MKMNHRTRKVVALSVLALCAGKMINNDKNRKRERKYWSRRIKREAESFLHFRGSCIGEVPSCLEWHLPITSENFQLLLKWVAPLISKQNTVMRESIPAQHKLALTLRYLATGEPYSTLMASTHIADSTISLFIPEVSNAIYTVLKDRYMMVPHTVEEWLKISKEFEECYTFPQCIGVLDGRWIQMRPVSEDSEYQNCKRVYSLLFMVVVDTTYKFLYADIGVNRKANDNTIFQSSSLGQALQKNILNTPEKHPLPGGTIPVPFIFVADEAFPMHPQIIKDFPKNSGSMSEQIFTCQVNEMKKISERAFGIFADRFSVFSSVINVNVEKVTKIALAACALHNFLCHEQDELYIPQQLFNANEEIDEWRGELCFSNKLARQSKVVQEDCLTEDVREEFVRFFSQRK